MPAVKVQPRPWLRKFDPAELVLATFRYFLGRCTIATCCFAQHELAVAWPHLPAKVQDAIRKELEFAFDRDDASRRTGGNAHPLGWDCDRQAWQHVRDAYTAKPDAKRKRVKRTKKADYLQYFHDARMMVVGSFRHHLGRTDLPAQKFAEALAESWDGIPEIDRNIVKRELLDAFKEDSPAYRPLGNAAMRHEWAKVADAWNGLCPGCSRVKHNCLCSHEED